MVTTRSFIIGPKLYGATIDVPPRRGSTRLHMDMADAINMLGDAAQKPQDNVEDALWQILSRHDVDKIRQYLREVDARDRAARGDRTQRPPTWDPINAQEFYLDEKMLHDLKAKGVVPFVIHQKVGEAVFIPSGCPHQVSRYFELFPIRLSCFLYTTILGKQYKQLLQSGM